jgi:hypothetical protein
VRALADDRHTELDGAATCGAGLLRLGEVVGAHASNPFIW